MHPAMADPDDNLDGVLEVVAYLRKHAAELREKGVPVDDMIKDLERQVEIVRAASQKVRDLKEQDEEFEREKVERRRNLDDVVGKMPPDLTDGMATLEYLRGIAEKEASRVRRGRKGLGG